MKELKDEEKLVYEFANKIAQSMYDLKSSHAWFIFQQGYGDSMSWDEVEELLLGVIEESKKRLKIK